MDFHVVLMKCIYSFSLYLCNHLYTQLKLTVSEQAKKASYEEDIREVTISSPFSI